MGKNKSIDNEGVISALHDLSKAFDYIVDDVFQSISHAYDFGFEFLTFLISYLAEKKQKSKVKIKCFVAIVLLALAFFLDKLTQIRHVNLINVSYK